jgi:hypothetical protein
VNRIRKAVELSKMENRVLNVVNSMTTGKKKFYLQDVIKMVDEDNKDFVIEAIELLLEKRIIAPSRYTAIH